MVSFSIFFPLTSSLTCEGAPCHLTFNKIDPDNPILTQILIIQSSHRKKSFCCCVRVRFIRELVNLSKPCNSWVIRNEMLITGQILPDRCFHAQKYVIRFKSNKNVFVRTRTSLNTASQGPHWISLLCIFCFFPARVLSNQCVCQYVIKWEFTYVLLTNTSVVIRF